MEGRNNYKKICVVFVCILMLGFSSTTAEASTTIKNLTKGVSNLGLQAFYSFDGDTTSISNVAFDGDVTDASGSGRDLYLDGGDWHEETSRTTGKTGQSLYFNGGNVATGTDLDFPSGNFTISVWFKNIPGSIAAGGGKLVSKTLGWTNFNYEVWLDSSTEVYGGLYDGTAAQYAAMTGVTLDDNKWHHVVFVVDSSNLKLYLDGVLGNVTDTFDGSIPNNDVNFEIGAETFFSGYQEGNIDEVRIYDRALSANEALALYKVGTSKGNVTPKNTISNSGLVGYWPFDGKDTIWSSSTAGTTNDISGTGNTGTLTNMLQTTATAVGKFGQALSFDGSDDYVDAGDPANGSLDFDISDPFSISAWVNRSTTGSNVGIVYKRTSTGSGYDFSIIGANNRIVLNVGDNFGSSFRMSNESVGTVPNAGQWYHVVTTYDGGGTSSGMHLYIDGVNQSLTNSFDGLGGGSSLTTTHLTIGARESGTSRQFNGKIDEVRVYDRTLSSGEITALYNLGAGTKSNVTKNKLIQNGLVGYWPFDGKYMDWSGPTATDATGAGHTGTPTNMTQDAASVIGKVGQGLLFDGSNDSVDIADSSVFDLSSSGKYTWSFWIKPITFGNLKDSFASYDGGGVNFFSVSTHTTSDTNYGACTKCVSVAWANTGGSNYLIAHTSDNVLSANTWSHVLITYDGTLSQSSRFVIYVDGVDVTNNGDIYSTGTISTISPATTQIGGEPSAHANAALDEFRFYNRKLSAGEIAQLARP